MGIEYKINEPTTSEQFIELLKDCSLGERRPITDIDCIEGMISNSNLTISAWESGRLIGIARCMTDFHYACYLSDLAVSNSHQKSGIGKQLQIIVQQQLGPKCKLILIAAPETNSYYDHIGFTNVPNCWILLREQGIRS
ncbi:MAG: GNAT family N-acetyltransferase [bacterium]